MASGCASEQSAAADAAAIDGGRDAGFDGGRDAGVRSDSGAGHDAALEDAGPDGDIFPPYRNRCPDEEIPGFKLLDGGWHRACNCFDGDPLRPVPTQSFGHHGEGLRTVPFDCDWPLGGMYSRGSLSIEPNEIDALGCEGMVDTVRGAGFVAEPFHDVFTSFSAHRPAGVARERICVPTECVFDTPGEPAHCSEECAPFREDVTIWGGYITVYRVDRSACETRDGGALDAALGDGP